MDRLLNLLVEAGGVARTRALTDRGISRHRLDAAVGRGTVVRARRGWVALPDADPYILAAARTGVVLTCITEAKRRGLWVLDEPEPHVAAPPHAGHISVRGRVHWAVPAVPRHPDRLVDEIENVLVLVATCQPFETALAVWESALRRREVDAEVMARLALPPAARRLLDEAEVWSDSGLETIVVPRLRFLRLPLRRQIVICGRPVDLLIGVRLVLQIDGGHHVGAQREADIAHDADLNLRGYHVIRVGYAQVVGDWPAVQERIMRAVAQGLHRAA